MSLPPVKGVLGSLRIVRGQSPPMGCRVCLVIVKTPSSENDKNHPSVHVEAIAAKKGFEQDGPYADG